MCLDDAVISLDSDVEFINPGVLGCLKKTLLERKHLISNDLIEKWERAIGFWLEVAKGNIDLNNMEFVWPEELEE